jgi:hypothetical protein
MFTSFHSNIIKNPKDQMIIILINYNNEKKRITPNQSFIFKELEYSIKATFY